MGAAEDVSRLQNVTPIALSLSEGDRGGTAFRERGIASPAGKARPGGTLKGGTGPWWRSVIVVRVGGRGSRQIIEVIGRAAIEAVLEISAG